MKKIIIASLFLSALLTPIQSQANTTTQTCKFPNGSQAVITGENTTIAYQHCQALKTNNESQCKTLIESAKEYTENTTAKKDEASNTIELCQVQIKDADKVTSKESDATKLLEVLEESSDTCITNDNKIENLGIPCTFSNPTENEGLQTLQQVFQNNFVYQLIEPITSENLVIQRRTCTYEFLRNKEGLIQPAIVNNDNIINQTRDPNSKLKFDRNDDFYNGLFTITEKECYVTYVNECTPNLILDARIRLNEDLPVSTYCKTYQVISGSSGTDFIKGFVNIIYRLSVGIIGVLAVIVMVINGIRISTAGDDSGAVSEAKERIAQSIFGLAVLFLAWIILRSVNPNFFTTTNLEITDPRATPTQQTQEANPSADESQ